MTNRAETIERCAEALTEALYDYLGDIGACSDVPEPWPDDGPVVCEDKACMFCRVARADYELRQSLGDNRNYV